MLCALCDYKLCMSPIPNSDPRLAIWEGTFNSSKGFRIPSQETEPTQWGPLRHSSRARG